MKNATRKCLEKIGYPTQVLMVDFESRFGSGKNARWPLGFQFQSNIEYITDSNWEFLGCGFRWMGGDELYGQSDGMAWFVEGPDIFNDNSHSWKMMTGDDTTVVFKNAKFDAMILKNHFGIVPKYIIDLDDLLRAYDSRMSHHLKDACKHFKLKNKGDTLKFGNLTYNEISRDPVLHQALIDYTINDIDRQCELLEIVLPQVDFTADEAFLARHTLDLYLTPRFDVDYKLGRSLEMGMKLQLHKVLKHYDKSMLNSTIKLGVAMGELLAESGDKLPLKHCKKNGKGKFPDATKNTIPVLEKYGDLPDDVPLLKARPAFAKDDDGAKWMLAHPDQRVRELMEARIGVKSWPDHIGKVRGIMAQAACSDGVLRVPLVYYGCHTGRWSGTHGINPLNMGSGGRGRPQHKLIGKVRGMLKARKGRVLAAPDSGQIEARKLAWLSGQDDLLKQFADDADPYSVLAEDIFQEKVWKWSDDDAVEREKFCVPEFMPEEEFKELKRNIKLWRGFGKDAILGCGYGMGKPRFYANCLQNPFLRPYFDDGTYSFDTVSTVINSYRGNYKKITAFWRRVEKAWAAATKFRGQKIHVNIPNSPSELVFFNVQGTTFIKLPSGRHLRYRNAKVDKEGKLKWRWGTLWGGSITENIDQASSRDLMTYWICKIEKEDPDVHVVLHCYDEIVGDLPESRGEECLEMMKDVMLTTPHWAEGMPLSVGGALSDRYCK